ncbi:complex I 24 kDa subunit family protein [Rhodothermus bifroesti]|jgi:NADH-quinone oxidoreductase subunit E|uniref:NAD(P)H-dependent oxidoreductase subunit E n=1 Tax=Rhodothermus marinus TaxID=29549 RepID=A0A7V2AZW6_RHOMR|nr:NAD(P)H-dependent oxidoreductase subunit E [Rhodothermus bifroesti]GBD02646.1 NADH-quinone oxidoreductase subunit 2 [bacterium HR18]
MADFIKNPIVPLPELKPEPQIPAEELFFTEAEKAQIARFKAQYLEPAGAVMKTLWLAQEKFGFLPPEVLQLVADELGIPYAQVYGVATFYTQYYKEKKGKYVLDVCTCFTCQVCGGYDILHYLEQKLGIHKGETTPDGLFTLQEVECLGACGSAPVLQVSNGPYVHNLTPEKIDQLLEALKQGQLPPFVSLTLPQDEQELGGNRRSDAEAIETYRTPPRAQHVR